MRRKPLVSVVIPTRNRGRAVLQAVASVLAQTVRDFELIVVDDASTDSTLRLLRPWRHLLTLVPLSENVGPARARNAGLERCRAGLVAFLDSDDLWRPWKLEKQLALLRNVRFVGAASDVDIAGPRGKLVVLRAVSLFQPLLTADCWKGRSIVACSTAVLRRRHVLRIGGFDEGFRSAYLEDVDFFMRLDRAYGPGRIAFSPEALVVRRGPALFAGLSRPGAASDPERLLDLSRWHIQRARGVYG